MRLGNGIRRSSYPGTKLQKWEKLPTSEYTEKDGILAAVIADKSSGTRAGASCHTRF